MSDPRHMQPSLPATTGLSASCCVTHRQMERVQKRLPMRVNQALLSPRLTVFTPLLTGREHVARFPRFSAFKHHGGVF